MEWRDLDFEIEITPDQWEELGRTAQTLGVDGEGFDWDEDRFDEIAVYLHDESAPELWRDRVGDEETYGAAERCVARFHFNDGRPYARIEGDEHVAQPVLSPDEGTAMQEELERWVRERWHWLFRRAGIHYDRGHLPQG